ncbi:MAG: rod shape-determining protein MreC [Candidatus Thioglobus sp.]|nr:rod shape-determining protein MreC [Candidatus Thioglobus sp.]
MSFLQLLIPAFAAIFLILSDYKFSYLDSIKQAIAQAVSPIYLVVNSPAQIYTWINEQGTTEQVLLNKNKQLNNELMRLKVGLQTRNALLLENQKLTKLLGASYQIGGQEFILARVNSVAQSRLKKQIVIDKGGLDGLEVGQVVLGAEGVVGQLVQVMPMYATLLMITDPTQYVPIKNQRNGVRGISRGLASHQSRLQANFIKSELDVTLGDVFLTSAVGSKFPAGYPVGRVSKVEKIANSPFLNIELTPIQTTQQIEFLLVNSTKIPEK